MAARRAALVAGVAAVALAGAALALRAGRGGPARPPNVVLVSIDTLRPDHLSAYGRRADTSPTIDAMAHAGVRFATAYSTSSWTAPAVVSMLTGTLPTQHGVIHGVERRGALFGQETIPDDIPVLAEILRQRGYQTFGVAANVHLAGEFGFARGFDRYDQIGFVDADRVLETVRTWKATRHADRPYFAWVHFLDPHEPYEPREPWLTQFVGGRPRHPDLDGTTPVLQFAAMHLDDDALAYVEALYDSEIRYTDERIRALFAELGVSDDDLVVVLSDHGEEFREHGSYGHGRTLYEENVRIPLIVRFPGRRFAGRVSDAPVSIMDVVPTIAAVAGAPVPPHLAGRSLLDLLGGGTSPPRPILLHLARRDVRLRSIVADGWKLVFDPRSPEDARLFDLRHDPGETVDRSAGERARADELRRMLVAAIGAEDAAPGTERAVSPEQVRALKALGYLE